MKFDIDTRFEGGPYNGNTFNVPDEQDEYVISHTTATYTVAHVYRRENDKFIYTESITNDLPE